MYVNRSVLFVPRNVHEILHEHVLLGTIFTVLFLIYY